MLVARRNIHILIGLGLSTLAIALLHLFSGQLSVSWGDMYAAIFDFDSSDSEQLIARELRIPRVLTAFFAGGALSLSGLLMQSLFRNPLAEPYILGINSGSSLFVALTVVTGIPFFLSDFGLITNALIGAFIFGLIILAFARFVKSQVSLLLSGIMLGSLTASLIAILQSISNANELKIFTLWGLGSLQKTSMSQIPYLTSAALIGLIISLLMTRQLNLLALSDRDASLLGLNTKRLRYAIIGLTALLSGVVTAFCGPIAFVGLAVPNIIRLIFKTQHHLILIPGSFILGALFLLLTDTLIQFLESWVLIPVNAITAIFGAPVVLLIIFRSLR